MAKKLVNINLDVDVIEEMDNVAKSLGVSRSAFANLVLRGAVMNETARTVKELLTLAHDSAKDSEESKGVLEGAV